MKINGGFLMRGAAVLSVGALLLIFGGAGASAQSIISPTPVSSPATSADLQGRLSVDLTEHVDLSADSMRAAYDGFGGAKFRAAAGSLDKNSVDLANMIGSVYGQQKQVQFLALWRKHIDYLNLYALAVKNNDQNLKQQEVNNLNNVAAPGMAKFLNQANPNLPVETVTKDLQTHEQYLLKSLDAYSGGDYTTSYSEELSGDSQALMMANMLANAIVRENPSQYP